MFGISSQNANQFLKFFSQVCNRCKEFIFSHCEPKIIRLRSDSSELNGEFTCRLVQKYYNGILDDKSKNKRIVHKSPEIKNPTSKSSKKVETKATLKTPMRTVNKSKK